MNVDRVLRESTRALTFTLPNSVTEAFGIFSVSSRSRSAEGFHSTDAAFTCCPTVAPPPGHGRCLAPVLPAVGHARLRPKLRDLGSVPRQGPDECRPGASYARIAAGTRRRDRERCSRRPACPGPCRWRPPRKAAARWIGNERKPRQETTATAHSARLGLDLWCKPLAVIHRWSRAGPLGANLLHLAQCVAQRAQPGVLVFPDQADAPGERVTAAAGHPGLDERVEHPALGLAQPGHDRYGKCGEHHLPALGHHAPGHPSAESPLRLAGDPDTRLPRLFAEPPAPPRRDRVRVSLPRLPGSLSRLPASLPRLPASLPRLR